MTCNHTRTREYWHEEEDWWSGETVGEWRYDTEITTVDLDLHRFKCTQCGEVMYYSGAAREYYETGVDRKGLFK